MPPGGRGTSLGSFCKAGFSTVPWACQAVSVCGLWSSGDARAPVPTEAGLLGQCESRDLKLHALGQIFLALKSDLGQDAQPICKVGLIIAPALLGCIGDKTRQWAVSTEHSAWDPEPLSKWQLSCFVIPSSANVAVVALCLVALTSVLP